MMEAPLRAFLMMRTDGGAWKVTVCRDLGAVVHSWKARKAPDKDVAVLHVGFDRPPSHVFDEIADSHPGLMLLTAGAKYALPPTFVASSAPIASTNNANVFIGLQGWGYSLEDPTINSDRVQPGRTASAPIALEGWIASFLNENPASVDAFSELGVHDDESYIARESELEQNIRHRSGVFRANNLLGDNRDDPCRLARSAPPWLTERELPTLDLPVRAKNVFRLAGIGTVQDLAAWSPMSLLKRKNFGQTSLRDTLNALNAALNEGPAQNGTDDITSEPSRLLTAVRQSFLACSSRERDILIRRLGFEMAPQTLEEISSDYNLTRERIRQIATRSTRKWIRRLHWNDLLAAKIQRLLSGRNFPLLLGGIEAIDPWFEGISAHQEFFENLINTICANRIHVIEVDGLLYLSLIDQALWEQTILEALALLSSGAGREWSEEYSRSLVDGLLPDTAKEFGPVLWEKSSQLCHFSAAPDGSRILTSYGRGAEQLVEAILAESESPLHYSEIAERASLRRGRKLDSRRAHSAATNVGILFGPGTYGLARHFPLSDQEVCQICTEVEDIVSSEESGRQWHTSEILSELSARLDDGLDWLNKYVLNIALAESTALRPLGRMTWTAAIDSTYDEARIEIHQAVVAILKSAGHPLTRSEISERLTAVRGVNEFFQILPVDPLIRLERGVWGINDRDVPLSRKEQRLLVEELVHILDQSQSGLHATELASVLTLRDCSPDAFLCIAIQDARLKMTQSRYVYLAAWGGPRRETIRDAVAAVLEQAAKPLTLEVIVALVEGRVGRTIDKPAISAALQRLEAEFDDAACEWRPRRLAAIGDDEDDEADVNCEKVRHALPPHLIVS